MVLLGYAAVAVIFSWPLPIHLATSLTGEPGGDTGVYVWNQWVFRHEFIKGGFPYLTNTLFGPGQLTDLSLHNYTTFADLVALVLRSFLTVIEAFNVVYLLLMVLGGYTAYLLAHHVTRDPAVSFIAGFLFGWSPIVITRGTGHFSLVATAPLAVFILLLLRAGDHIRVRDAIALGATIAWASMTDVYYAVFCLLIGAVFVISRVVSVKRRDSELGTAAVTRGLNVALWCAAIFVATIAITGGWRVNVAGLSVSARSLYTPVLVLTVLAMIRFLRRQTFTISALTAADLWRFARIVAVTGAVTAVLAAPLLYAALVRVIRGEFDTPAIYWRSSPPGVDLLAFVLPNPNHPLAPDAIAAWLTTLPQAYIENVASLPYVGMAIMFFAWRAGWRPSRWWVGVSVAFGLLALGPFVHVAGQNTFVPGPWALLRYVPLVGFVHTPARFAILFTLCFAIVVADALRAWSAHHPHRQRLLIVAGFALAVELLPAPMTMYPAEAPALFRHVAAAPPSTVLLEMPFGVADGTSSIGNFGARAQFHQTAHGRTIMGGFLSRVPRRRFDEALAHPVQHALVTLSEKKALSTDAETALLQQGPAFVREKRIGFVVVNRDRTTPAAEALVARAFQLRHVETNDSFVLYATDAPVLQE